MVDKDLKCTSCRVKILSSDASVRFMCPNCGKIEIIRCKKCRVESIPYTCSECGFEGPN
jgi:Zn-ribbon RNA-binding protein